jgi:putative membrane protein
MRFLIRILVIAAVSFGLAHVLKGIHIDTSGRPCICRCAGYSEHFCEATYHSSYTPVTILTLGLFLFVINALVVMLASRFVDGITVTGFWWALIFSLILSVVTSILDREFDKERRRSIL